MTANRPKFNQLGGTHQNLIRRILSDETLNPDDIDDLHDLAEAGAIEYDSHRNIIVHAKPSEYDIKKLALQDTAQATTDAAHLVEAIRWRDQVNQILTGRANSTEAEQALKRRIAVLDRFIELLEAQAQ